MNVKTIVAWLRADDEPCWSLDRMHEAAALIEQLEHEQNTALDKLDAAEERMNDMLTTLGQVGHSIGVTFEGNKFTAGIGEKMIDAAIVQASRLSSCQEERDRWSKRAFNLQQDKNALAAKLEAQGSRLGEAEKHLRAAASCLGHAPVTKGSIEDFLAGGVERRGHLTEEGRPACQHGVDLRGYCALCE